MMKSSLAVLALITVGTLAYGEDQRKIRVFIPDSSSWEVSGGVVGPRAVPALRQPRSLRPFTNVARKSR